MAGRSFEGGGGGKGPLGGGLIGIEALLRRLCCPIEVLLLVRGGNIGRPDGSIADAGVGMSSRLLEWGNRGRGASLCWSGVSKERCCREIPGGGDLSAIPVGVVEFWVLVVMVG